MKTVLSGIQSSGNLHLGNYLGSIQNWVGLQENHRCIFGVMNLHAITLPQDAGQLQKNTLDAVAIYLACGIDHKKSIIFIQSEIAQHAELAWILGCITPIGWLNRMTQFKEKSNNIFSGSLNTKKEALNSRSGAELVNLGLYSYPVLMAADILLYNADLVPVGEDQKQHLELTRDLAGAFNRRYKNQYFKLAEAIILKNVRRIMSLQDGQKKMSKSDKSDLTRINLEDQAAAIATKIKKAKTDSLAVITYDINRPEIYNLLNIFAAISGKTPQLIATEYENAGNGKFKAHLAEIIIEKLTPIQKNLSRLRQEPSYLKEVLKNGTNQATEIAAKTRQEVFAIAGLKCF
jgi:tryptophanyl-tRNA synthetase